MNNACRHGVFQFSAGVLVCCCSVMCWLAFALVATEAKSNESNETSGWFEVQSVPPGKDDRLKARSREKQDASAGGSRAHGVQPASPVADDLPPIGVSVSRFQLNMFVGQVEVAGPVSVERVAVGNGQVVQAEVLSSNELMIIAEGAGSTSVRLWHTDGRQTDYNVRVSDTDPETRFRKERMVHMKVRMIEFRKSALDKLGIDWNDALAGPTLATAGDVVGNNLFRPANDALTQALPATVQPFSSYLGITSSLRSKIDLMQASGDAVTLAEPVLSCENGGTASFLAGGEVPYPSANGDGGSTVQFKEYGVKLDISPRIDSAGNVQTMINTEISQLDPAVSIQGTPGFLTRRASSAVNVRSGQTIVLSGLLASEQGQETDGIPGLSRIPFLGAVFRTRQTRSYMTELVIFITPHVITRENSDLAAETNLQFENGDRKLNAIHRSLMHDY